MTLAGFKATVAQMEVRLLELSERYLATRDPDVQREYRELHARWMAAKAGWVA